MKVRRTWQETSVAILLAITGLGIFIYWAWWISRGNLVDGVRTVENGQLIIFHIAAEIVMALLALTGVLGLLIGRRWARSTAFIAIGMLIYASINGFAFSVNNDSTLTPIFIASLLTALICSALLWSSRTTQMSSERMQR